MDSASPGCAFAVMDMGFGKQRNDDDGADDVYDILLRLISNDAEASGGTDSIRAQTFSHVVEDCKCRHYCEYIEVVVERLLLLTFNYCNEIQSVGELQCNSVSPELGFRETMFQKLRETWS